jgi:hypothetical protein
MLFLSQTLAASLNEEEIALGMCFPSVKRIREITASIAHAGVCLSPRLCISGWRSDTSYSRSHLTYMSSP